MRPGITLAGENLKCKIDQFFFIPGYTGLYLTYESREAQTIKELEIQDNINLL